jgi:hypothetical protein
MNKLLILFYLLLQFGLMPPSVNKSFEVKSVSVQSNTDTPCEGVDIDMNEKTMIIKNLKAPHIHDTFNQKVVNL